MPVLAAPVAIASALLFAGLVLMTDRKRGASVAQGALVLACILVFAAIVAEGPILGVPTATIGTFGNSLIAASVAGLFYHLYLGRFATVWSARAVFTALYLLLALMMNLDVLSQR